MLDVVRHYKMKYSLTIIFLICSFVAESQVGNLFFNRVDSSNNEDYYRRLQENIKVENIDSSFEAINLIFELHSFDSIKYNSNLLNPILKQIEKFQLGFFKKTIIGKWQSESLGSDWFNTKEKMFNPNKRFIFNGIEAVFYLRDSLIRRTSYSIVSKELQQHNLKFKRFFIVFLDTKEEWSFYFITKGNLVPFHGKAHKLHLIFNKEPNCACGCREELYSIELDSTITIAQQKHLRNWGLTEVQSTAQNSQSLVIGLTVH